MPMYRNSLNGNDRPKNSEEPVEYSEGDVIDKIIIDESGFVSLWKLDHYESRVQAQIGYVMV